MHILPLKDDVTALSMAAQEGHKDTVRLLLQYGAKDLPNKVKVNIFTACCGMYLKVSTRE